MKPPLYASAALLLPALLVVVLLAYIAGGERAALPQAENAVAPATVAPATVAPVSPLPTPVATAVSPYVFSEPQVVLTSTRGIYLGDWLPDSRSLIVSVENTEPDRILFEDIFLLDPITGETESFGRRRVGFLPNNPPKWVSDTQEMVFVGANVLCSAEWCPLPDLWVTQAGTTQLVTPLLEGVTTIAGHGHQVLAIRAHDPFPVLIDVISGEQRIVPIDLRTNGIDTTSGLIQAIWHPSAPRVAIFDGHGFLLLHLDTNQVEKIDLGIGLLGDPSWALSARWSPNGEWIAMILTEGRPPWVPAKYTRLALFKVATGQVTHLDLGYPYPTDPAWAPDSKGIAVLAVVGRHELGFDHYGLFLTDVDGTPAVRIFEDYLLGGLSGANLSWSPNGTLLAVYCPTPIEIESPFGSLPLAHRLCISSVYGSERQ